MNLQFGLRPILEEIVREVAKKTVCGPFDQRM